MKTNDCPDCNEYSLCVECKVQSWKAYDAQFGTDSEPRIRATHSEPHVPEATDYHRLFDCPNPVTYCDGSARHCACPEPIRDYENGYCNELSTGLRDWFDYANSTWGTGSANIWLKKLYPEPQRLEEISMRESPFLKYMTDKHTTIVSPAMYDSLASELGNPEPMGAEALCDTYPAPNRKERRRLAAETRRYITKAKKRIARA
jgi:hypothetical protein